MDAPRRLLQRAFLDTDARRREVHAPSHRPPQRRTDTVPALIVPLARWRTFWSHALRCSLENHKPRRRNTVYLDARGAAQRIALKLRATRPPRGVSLNDSSCAPAHNTPLPLERSPPGSFKRLLGSPSNTLVADEARIDVWLLEPSPQERDDCYDVLPEWRRNPLYCGLELLHNGRKLELIEH